MTLLKEELNHTGSGSHGEAFSVIVTSALATVIVIMIIKGTSSKRNIFRIICITFIRLTLLGFIAGLFE